MKPKPSPRKSRRHFKLDALEPRLLLSASPSLAIAAFSLHTAHTTAPLEAGSESPAGLKPDVLTDVSWTAGVSGDWGTASNWSNDAVPTSNDIVSIPVGVTVTISSGAQAADSIQCSGGLTISGGSLTLTTDSSVTGAFSLGGGTTLTTNGVFTVGGASTLGGNSTIAGTGSFVNSGTATISNNLTLSAAFQNNLTVNWTGGNLNFGSAVTFTNANVATFNISGDGSMNYSGTLANAGLITSTSDANESNSITCTFNNTGTVHVTGGTLVIDNSGTSSGTFNVDSSAALDFDAGPDGNNYMIADGSQWNGAGLYEITNFMTVTLADASVALSVQNLSLSGYTTLSVGGSITVPSGGTFAWEGGTISGAGSVTIASGATFTSSGAALGLETTLTNYGTATFVNSSIDFGNGVILTNAVYNSEPGGIFNFSTTGTGTASFYGGTGTFSNGGTLNIAQNGGSLGASIALNNTSAGTINITAGTLGLSAGGTSAGVWDVSSNATLDLEAGYTFNAGSAWNGAGAYIITSGFYAAPVLIATGLTLTPANFQMATTESSLEVNGTLTIPSGGNFLAGYDDIGTRITGTGTINIEANATMNIGDGQGWLYISGVTLNNYGTIYLDADSTFSSVSLGLDTNAILFNFSKIIIQNNGGTPATSLSIGDYAYLDNFGSIAMNASAALTMQLQFNNDGSLNVTNGSVTFTNDDHSAGVSSGSFTVAANSSITFYSSQTLSAGASFNGAGSYTVDYPSVLTINDPSINLSPLDFSLTDGTITGTGKFTVTTGSTFDWTGGTIGLSGGFYVQTGVTLAVNEGTGYLKLVGGLFDNSGTINLTDGLTLSDSAVLTNEANATINVQISGFGDITDDDTCTMNNYGNLVVTASTSPNSSTYFGFNTFNNTGTVEVQSGQVEFAGSASQLSQVSADKTTLTGGTWIVNNGGSLQLYGVFLGANEADGSTITTNEATVILDGAGSNFAAISNLSDNSGTIELLGGATLSSPSLTNSGTLEIGSTSKLSVSGNYTQTSTGILTDVLEGTAASGDFGTLAITGAADLAGTLKVLIQGFTPATGDVYTLLTYSSRSGNFTTLQNVSPTFLAAESGTSYTLTGQNEDVPDLSAGDVSGPGTATSGQEMTVTYTVTNGGAAAATGSWTDTVYLSPGTTFDPTTAVVLGQSIHTGGLDVGDSYNGSVTAIAPALSPGNYTVFVITDSLGQVSDSDRANNQAASTSSVAVSAPKLTLGTPLTGTIANGGEELYELDLSGNVQVQLSLATAVAAGAEIYVGFGSAPTASSFDQTAFNVSGTTDTLTINASQSGPYYILVRGRESSGTGAGFTLTATEPSFGITSLTPSSGAGTTTITIQGSQFAADDTVTLIPDAGGSPLAASSFYYANGNTIAATFNLAGLNAGAVYDVQVANGTQTDTATAAFTVGQSVTSVANPILVTITAPEYARVGVNYTIQVNYQNVSGQDANAPLISVNATNALLKLAESSVFASGTIDFLGLNTSGGPVGILPAGYQGSTTVQVEQSVVQSHTHFTYTYSLGDPSGTMDYSALEPYLESSAYSSTEWTALWADLQQRLGPTEAGYLNALAQDASLLPASVGYADNPIDVMQIEVEKSAANVTNSISGQVTTTSPGLQLGGLFLDAVNTDTGDSFGVPLLNNGSFSLSGLTMGDYTFSLDGAILGTAAAVPVGANQQVTGVALTATAGATLSGTTTNAADGSILAGANITAIGSNGTRYTATSGANGAYSLAGLPTDTYSITATANGTAQLLEENVAISPSGLVLNLSPGVASAITGTIAPTTNTNGDSPLISAQTPGNTDPNLVFSVDAASNGAFDLNDLPAGTYNLTVSLNGYVQSQILGVTVATGGTQDVGTVTLAAVASVSGTVSSNDPNTAVSGFSVGVYQGTVLVASGVADANGNYTIGNLAAGSYNIEALTPTTVPIDIPITLSAGEALTGQDLVVQPGGSISGTVDNSTSQTGIAGLNVLAKDASGNFYLGVTTSSGAYTISGLLDGTYQVFVQGIASQTQTVTVTDASNQTNPTANFNFAFNYDTGLTGAVLDGSGNAISTGQVLLEQNNQVIAETIVNSDGDYSFLLAQGGTYELAVISADGSFAPVTGVVVTTGNTLTQNVTAGSSSLTVTASDAAGAVAGDNAALYLQTASGPVLAGIGSIGSDGTVTFANLINGSYVAVVQSAATVGQVAASVSGASQAAVSLAAQLTLSGVVSNSGATGIAGAAVTLTSTTTGLNYTAQADANGNYSVGSLPAGTYGVVVGASNYQTQVISNLSVSANTQDNVTLTNADRTVTGTVVDQGSNPIQAGTVTATDSAGNVLGQAALQNDGTFSIGTLSNTAFTLTVSVNGYAPAQLQNLTVSSGQDSNLGSIPLTAVALAENEPAAEAQSIGAAEAKSGAGLKTLDTPPTIVAVPQVYIQSVYNLVEAALISIQKDNFAVPAPPGCPDASGAYGRAVQAVNAFNAFKKDVMLPATQAVVVISLEYIGTILAETLNLAANLYLTYISLPAVVAAAEAGIATAGAGSAAAAIDVAIIRVIPVVNTFIQSIVTEATQLQSVGSGPDIVSTANNVRQLAQALFGQFGSLNTLANGPSKGLIPPGVSGVIGVITNLLSSYAITIGQYPQFEQVYTTFQNLYSKYQDLKAQAQAALDALGQEAAKSAGGCGNHNGGGTKIGGSGGSSGSSGGGGGVGTMSLSGHDPNDLYGPAGYGPQNFVQASQPLGYTIDFQNDPGASAATAVVEITETLDLNLNLSTFSLGAIGFGAQTIAVPAGLTAYNTIVNDTANSGYDVAVSASLDVSSRTVTWTFTTLDPTTGKPPANPIAGFLPPDVNGSGEGYVSYTVSPSSGLATGTVIQAQASVVFDANAAIATPVASNTLDAVAPTSHVDVLPVKEAPQFTLQWSGMDDTGGSGLADYNIYDSMNGGPYMPFLLDTTRTAAVFNGIIGNTYSFYSVAVDNVGNTELAPASPNATTTVVHADLATIDSKKSFSFTDADGNLVTIKLSGPGSAVAMLEGGVGNNADLRTLTLSDTTNASALSITVKKVGSSDGATSVEEILTEDANESIGSISLGAGVSLGSGLNDGSMALDLSGGVKSMTLGGLNEYAQVGAGGTIGQITLDELNRTGAAVAIDEASFSAASFGNILVDLTGTTAMTSGTAILDSTFVATAGNIGNITAAVTSGAAAANLTAISGSSFTASGSIGLITAGATGTGKTPTGGSATAITNGDGSVDFTAGTSIAGIRASAGGSGGANIALDGTSGTPIDFAAGTSIGAITLIANKARNASSSAFAAQDIDITAGTSIGIVAISGSATQAQADNFNITAGASIAGLSIGSAGISGNGSLVDSIVLAGQKTTLTSNASLAKAGIGYVTLSGSLIGSSSTPDSTIGAVGNIGVVSIGGAMTDESLVAGFNAGADGIPYTGDDSYNRNASIASVTVGGAFDTSSIVAGVNPGSDEYWGGTTDVEGTAASGVTHTGKIGAIKLGAATVAMSVTNPFGSPATGIEGSAIESVGLTSVQIGKLKALTSFSASHWINSSGSAENSSDTVIRIVS